MVLSIKNFSRFFAHERGQQKSCRSLIFAFVLLLVALEPTFRPEPVYAQGLGMCGPVSTLSSAEIYCQNHGGCPGSGRCTFPDGSYCDLWSFYNGTCPSRSTVEQSVWDAETYWWLNSDDSYGYNRAPVQNPAASSPAYFGVNASANSARSLMAEGDSQYQSGSYEQAEAMYSQALSLDKTLTSAWIGLGSTLYVLHRYQESLSAFESAINLEPLNANAWIGKGYALSALGRTAEADMAMERARALQAG